MQRAAVGSSCVSNRLIELAGEIALLAAFPLIILSSPAAAGEPAAKPADAAKWTSLFDGKTLGAWTTVDKYDFKRHGKVFVKDGCLVLEEGSPATGVRWTGKLPKTDYDMTFEARRLKGSDFFCGLTFPVGDTGLTLILGGWGGWVVGLSNIDDFRAVDNETCQAVEFKDEQWYRVRLKVTEPKVEVWLDEKQIIELPREKRRLSVDWVMEPCMPLGIATWDTTGAFRKIQIRPIGGSAAGKTPTKP